MLSQGSPAYQRGTTADGAPAISRSGTETCSVVVREFHRRRADLADHDALTGMETANAIANIRWSVSSVTAY